MITSSLKALVSLTAALIKTYSFPSAVQSSFNLVTLTVLLNSGIRYLNPIVLLVFLISLNLNVLQRYSAAAFRTNYDVTNSRSDANAAGHVIFY